MIKSDTKLFFAPILYTTKPYKNYWDSLYEKVSENSKFWLNIAAYFDRNTLVARAGTWESPWDFEVIPMLELPQYNPDFSKSFEIVTDERALEIKNLINSTGARVAVYYSGGIDSVLTLVSLLRNLDQTERAQLDVYLSSESIIENPHFFERHIYKKINVVDSVKYRYSDVENKGNYAISSDQGDSIFGTELGTHFYHIYSQLLTEISVNSRSHLESLKNKMTDPETHYTEFADMLIRYFQLERDVNFGKKYYEKLILNINTSHVPVFSLHDFFWWHIFNVKYVECALRSSVYYHEAINLETAINKTIINWYNHKDYQLWSMVNNNNNQKMLGSSLGTYKWAARQYIYAFDKNDWYFRYKSKLSSMRNIFLRNDETLKQRPVFAITADYERLYLDDPDVQKFIIEKLQSNY